MREILAFQWRVLTFRAAREELETLDSRHLAASLIWVWLVGIGRWWDDPRAGILQKLGLGSIAYVFVLAFVLWLVFRPLHPSNWWYGQVLTCVCLTAPPAVLYAIPIERWMVVQEAAQVNLWFLGVVALWRVALWCFMVRRLTTLPAWLIGIGTFLPMMLAMVALTLLNLSRGVLEIMSGMRAPTADDLSAQVVSLLGQLSFLGAIPMAIVYGLCILSFKTRPVASIPESEVDGPVS